jgi:septal ring factor EnvC (AmiA/AmiB activator)
VASEQGRLAELGTSLDGRTTELDAAEAALAEREEALAASQSASTARADELGALQAQLDQRTTDLDGVAASLAARETAVAAREAAAASSGTGASGATTAGPAAGPAYFENCDAARAAGAAPVRVGDPGYRAGLDRDGDGIGCE